MDKRPLAERILELGEKLVAINSVVGTDGEAEVAEAVHERLQACEYFKKRPRNLRLMKITGASNRRAAVLALYRPTKCRGNHLVVLMGHVDTVGIDEYGKYAASFGDSSALSKVFAKSADKDAAADASSGKYLFGRGWLDMKGGVAMLVETFVELTGRDDCCLNLVLCLCPDEEGSSAGVRQVIPALRTWVKARGLQTAFVLNADYTAPLAENDPRRFVYLGTVGKVLPTVAVFGKEAHVGQAFEGINASALAGEIAAELDLHPDLVDAYGGEHTLPPTVLALSDAQREYSVKTPAFAYTYVNQFYTNVPPDKMLKVVKRCVGEAVESFDARRKKRYREYVKRTHQSLPFENRPVEVVTFGELVARIEHQLRAADSPLKAADEVKRAEAETAVIPDERRRAVEAVRRLYALLKDNPPMCVVFLSPPFYPSKLNRDLDAAEFAMKVAAHKTAEYVAGENLTVMHVYPYIADMSFFGFDRRDRGQHGYWENAPLTAQREDLEALAVMNLPVVNIGPIGKGGHHMSERVEKKYLCEVLPSVVTHFLKQFADEYHGE